MQQMALDGWFLRQDIVERLLSTGSESDEASAFGDRIMRIAAHDGAEHQALSDPIDRSIALVLSLVREEGLNAWDIDLRPFWKSSRSACGPRPTVWTCPLAVG